MWQLRAEFNTDFHRQLATPEWLAQLHQTLSAQPALQGSFQGELVALYTDPVNMGPQSALKYIFQALLTQLFNEDCPLRRMGCGVSEPST